MKFKDLDLLKIGNTIQLVGAVYEGEGQTLLCFFPGDHDTQSVLNRLDMTPEEWEKFIRQTDIMETEILQRAPDGTLAKAIFRKSQRQIEAVVSWKVFKRDGYRCRYCGNDNIPLTVDHLILWEEGGPSIEANLVSACKKCNRVRGNTPYEKWLQHAHYRQSSQKLTGEVRAANEALLGTLSSIPLTVHQRSR